MKNPLTTIAGAAIILVAVFWAVWGIIHGVTVDLPKLAGTLMAVLGGLGLLGAKDGGV